MARVFIGIGSNINPGENVRGALRLLGQKVRIVGISTFYSTEAEGRPDQPPFYNGVIEAETDFPPAELKHAVLLRIEEERGRKREEDKCAPRTIDLDVLLYDDLVEKTDDLVIPDPLIAHRPFLAIPLHELVPDLVLPDTGARIEQVAAALANHGMKPLPKYTEALRREIEDGQRQG